MTICSSRSSRMRCTDMRALFTSLTILAFLLTGLVGGCDKPAPSDYWAGDPKAAQSGAGAGKTFEKLMAEGTRANLAGRPDEAQSRVP